ncbi:hypothetical protein Poras_1433 [Porphyromonas asaccharolytica DSM 20707]|uniref:Uncharacterized protein n=1 Tax=Porphyromonas asaccharolytica (strain ATCC 25260 / DSM 20707 / BCRC 10618 / CCUG 7834 / JCM 6326 / LMG 13178 / VPI 4198 / B440) TaxID=879243 RepID=F4KMY8_PORAD|nr:hypothetical protein Poras_1433 [Porphyromonas asaccharolytica DSM 20707]
MELYIVTHLIELPNLRDLVVTITKQLRVVFVKMFSYFCK